MQNEILKPVLATDETAIPRYDIVNPDGSVSQQNVELRLKNEVMQEGTPYDEESVLPAELATQLGLTSTATLAQALQLLATKSYDKDETFSNETKTLFSLGSDAVPNDAFLKLYHGISSNVIFEAVIEGSETRYIIDLRDVDYSKYQLFAFVMEREATASEFYVYPCFNSNGNPVQSTKSYSMHYAYRNESNNEISWSTDTHSFMRLSDNSLIFLFKFNQTRMTALYLSTRFFEIGFSSCPNGYENIYGLSVNNLSSQAKIKILGLNLR